MKVMRCGVTACMPSLPSGFRWGPISGEVVGGCWLWFREVNLAEAPGSDLAAGDGVWLTDAGAVRLSGDHPAVV